MNKKILVVAIITLIIDQISKTVVEYCVSINTHIKVIKNFFYINIVHNTGTAFGLFENALPFIIIGTIIAILLIYHFMYCFKNNTRNNIAFGLLYGGLAGNLLDRIFSGYVIDFLDFYIGKYDYPVFNVADIAIVGGVILLIYATIRGEEVNEDNSRRRKCKDRQVSSK